MQGKGTPFCAGESREESAQNTLHTWEKGRREDQQTKSKRLKQNVCTTHLFTTSYSPENKRDSLCPSSHTPWKHTTSPCFTSRTTAATSPRVKPSGDAFTTTHARSILLGSSPLASLMPLPCFFSPITSKNASFLDSFRL